MTGKLGIYARQSRDKETNGSIEDQIMQGTNKAIALKMPFNVYTDKGKSAVYDNFDNRPEFKRLLEDVESGEVTAVFVYDLTRLTRNEVTNLSIKQVFKKYGILIYTVLDGTVDYNDRNNVLFNDMKNLFAAVQVDDMSSKIKSVLRKNVLDGRAHGGVIKPYGYTSDSNKMLIIDNEEAIIVREIYNLALIGYGSEKIANILNKRGVETKTYKLYKLRLSQNINADKTHSFANSTWAGNTVLNILKNSLYKGVRIHKNEEFDAPQIIETDLWEAVQATIKGRVNKPSASKHNYLLNDLCYCTRCNSRFRGRTRPNKRDHIYYCASRAKKMGKCGIRAINITTLDSIVWMLISNSEIIINKAKEEVQKISNPDYLVKLEEERSELEKKIKTESDNKMKIFSMFKKELLSVEEAENDMAETKKIISEYEKRLKEIKLKLEDDGKLNEKIDYATEFIKKWDELVFTDNFELQHTLVKMFIERIDISFDDDTDNYTINVKIKLPETYHLFTFNLDTQGKLDNFSNLNDETIETPSIILDDVKVISNKIPVNQSLKDNFEKTPPKVIEPHR